MILSIFYLVIGQELNGKLCGPIIVSIKQHLKTICYLLVIHKPYFRSNLENSPLGLGQLFINAVEKKMSLAGVAKCSGQFSSLYFLPAFHCASS